MNEDFTLHAFAEPITDLPTNPLLSPEELKRRLQAPADEVRQVHNALAKTVKGITDATYPDTVTRDMLAPAVRQELTGKAEETDLAALENRVNAAESAVAEKCTCYFGTYTGNGAASRMISLGFTPKAVLVMETTGFTCLQYNGTYSSGGLATATQPVRNDSGLVVQIVDNGFTVYCLSDHIRANQSNKLHVYLAFR